MWAWWRTGSARQRSTWRPTERRSPQWRRSSCSGRRGHSHLPASRPYARAVASDATADAMTWVAGAWRHTCRATGANIRRDLPRHWHRSSHHTTYAHSSNPHHLLTHRGAMHGMRCLVYVSVGCLACVALCSLALRCVAVCPVGLSYSYAQVGTMVLKWNQLCGLRRKRPDSALGILL